MVVCIGKMQQKQLNIAKRQHYFAYRSGGFVSLEVLHFFSALEEFVFAESNLSYNICN